MPSPMMEMIGREDHRMCDVSLELADRIECLISDSPRRAAEMIAVAVTEGMLSAKDGRSIRTNAAWHDRMCSVAGLIHGVAVAS